MYRYLLLHMEFFAWIANILVFIYKLPQIYKLHTAQDTTGLSVYSFCIQAVSYILYILHGFFNNDNALLFGMLLPLLQNLFIISMYFKIVARSDSKTSLNHSGDTLTHAHPSTPQHTHTHTTPSTNHKHPIKLQNHDRND